MPSADELTLAIAFADGQKQGRQDYATLQERNRQLERVADEMAEKFREVINVCDRNTELFAQAKEALASYAAWKGK